ncbi:replication factor A protein [Trifolium pratense]|uniref:Replication factor A protein n=2 Tax=Trifolium pratense TaxID=57577 RepID=A0A2K3MYM0_TRIPR|nr:replication factor A protein [Trifolium pratense]
MALTVSNVNLFSNIDEINSDRATWNFKAKIIRLWQVSDFNRATLPFSIEMVLMDKDGAYRTTRHPYKLNFQFSSSVQRLTNFEIVTSPFSFVPIAEVVGGCYDTDFLVDVIGFLTGVGQEREITNHNGTTTKLNVIELEADGHKLQCTLFGPYVDELNTFLSAGDVDNVVVIVQLAKAKTFQDKIHIQNCMNCSVVIFNPSCEESVNLRASLADSVETPSPLTLTQLSVESSVRPLDEFLYNTPRITLQGLKDTTNESVNVVVATVKRILNPESYWYTACSCGKAVIPDSGRFFCEKCDKHVPKVFPRFCIKVRVMDHTDSATLVIFDKDASLILNMSCADLIQGIQGTGAGAGGGELPPQIEGMVEKTWLFKVEAKPSHNPRFDTSYRVRKICTDNAIIKQFKDKWDNEEAVFLKNKNEGGSLSTLLDKGKNVYVGGSSNVLSEDHDNFSGNSFKGKEIILEGTPLGVSQDLMIRFSNAVVDLDDDTMPSASPKQTKKFEVKEIDAAMPSVCSKQTKKVEVKEIDADMPSVCSKQIKQVEVKEIAVAAANLECSAPVRPPGQRKKTVPKRLSPQNEDKDEDDNAPIKLLKRAIKIEKLP